MPLPSRSLFLALRTGLLVVIGGCNLSFADPARPFPEHFPDFQYYDVPLLRMADGKTLTVGALSREGPAHAIAVIRTNVDGTPDLAFGKGGLVQLSVWGAADYGRAIAQQPDGKLLVLGNAHDPSGTQGCRGEYCQTYVALFRLEADGRQERTFNGTGRLLFHADPYETGYIFSVEAHASGMILLKAWIGDYPDSVETVVGRVLANGVLDTTFIRTDRNVPLTPVAFTVAVDFYNASLDQYFVTADAGEIAGLDRNPTTGWRWGTSGFRVDPAGTNLSSTSPVCRYYGNPEAGLISHVQSVNAAECDALAAAGGAHWIFESHEVFRVAAPDGVTGACEAGRKPVYRLWNGRRDSGHTLTTDTALRSRLLAKGYIPEGWGDLGVAMCAAP